MSFTTRTFSFAMAIILASTGCGRSPSSVPPTASRPRFAGPFQGTPHEVVEEMLKLAEVTKADKLYDLGSGDGRIVLMAAKTYGCKAVGIDTDEGLIKFSREEAKLDGVEHLVDFRVADAFASDYSDATVVTVFLLPHIHKELGPVFQKKLKPGARVVAHLFDMGDWKPLKTIDVKDKQGEPHKLFLWKIEDSSPEEDPQPNPGEAAE